MQDVTLSLLLAGYDTTAWSYLVLLVLLPQLPARIVQRLRDEQQQVHTARSWQLTMSDSQAGNDHSRFSSYSHCSEVRMLHMLHVHETTCPSDVAPVSDWLLTDRR